MIRSTLFPQIAGAPSTSRLPAARQTNVSLTEAERSSIESAFPESPAVAQRLYGPGREVQTRSDVGQRFDLIA